MWTWVKVGLGVFGLYLLATRTKTGAQAVAAIKQCPPGSVPGPWFTCVPTCPQGWTHGVSDGSNSWLPAGTGYCYGGGSIDLFDEAGNVLATSGSLLQGAMNPFTGQPMAQSSTAATGVDGNTITVDPNGSEVHGNPDGPITSPNDIRLGIGGNSLGV